MIECFLRLFSMEGETQEHGRELWLLIASYADAIMSDFYRKFHVPDISPPMTPLVIERLKHKQRLHWASLFGSRFDENYANSVRRIGIRHRDIKLAPYWYVAGYMTLRSEFANVVHESHLPPDRKERLLKALDKYVAVDMALALSAYDAAVVN